VPDRILREALLNSDRWNDLHVDARDLYIRLLLCVDDFGCFDGRESVIRAEAYPTLYDAEPRPLIAKLHAADMLVRYSNAGKPYIALTRWPNELLGRRRFPAPPVNNLQPLKPFRGKYSRPISWVNPEGCDPVSVLLDLQMRPTVPQPAEWRMVDKDCAPNASKQAPRTDGAQGLQTNGEQPLRTVVIPEAVEVKQLQNQKQLQSPESVTHGEQSLPTATTPTNGAIKRSKGAWHGVSEAQELAWQDMFDSVSVPDQLARAGEWLDCHPEEHARIAADGSEHAYILRWLLKEVRPSASGSRPKPDA